MREPKESKLHIQLVINEMGLTPDPTNVNESLHYDIQDDACSLSRRIYTASVEGRLYRNSHDTAKDKMFYIKNIGPTNFDVKEATGGGSVGNTFAGLASGDILFFRLKKNKDIFLKNLSSLDNGKIEFAYWECNENV